MYRYNSSVLVRRPVNCVGTSSTRGLSTSRNVPGVPINYLLRSGDRSGESDVRRDDVREVTVVGIK